MGFQLQEARGLALVDMLKRHEMGWSFTQVWQLRIGRNINTAEVPPEEPGLNPTVGSPVQTTSARKRSSHNIWQWKSVYILSRWDKGLLEYQEFLLRAHTWTYLQTESLLLSSSAGQQIKKHRAILGGIKLSGFRERARGAALGETEVLAGTMVPLFSLPPI